MALTTVNPYGNPSNIFDSSRYLGYYLQKQARQQAKAEALDSYFNNLNKSINPAGVRSQDLNGWMQKVNQSKEFYNQNKEFIKDPRKDNGKAYTEYLSRHQDLLADVEKSKGLAAVSKQIAPVFLDPTKRERLHDGVVGELAFHDASMYDQKHKPFSLSSLEFDDTPFDDTKWMADATRGLTQSQRKKAVIANPADLTQTIVKEFFYDKDALNALRQRSTDKFLNDKRAKAYVDQIDTPENLAALNDVFKEAYGTNIKSPEDVFTAATLNKVQMTSIKEDVQADWRGRNAITNAQANARQARGHELSKRLVDYRKAKGDGGDNAGSVDVAAKKIEELYSAGKERTLTVNGKLYKGRTINPPSSVIKGYAQAHLDGETYQDPYEFVLTEDRKGVIPIFRAGPVNNKTGKQAITTKEDEIIPIERFYDDMQMHYATKSQVADQYADDGEVDAPRQKRTTRKSAASKQSTKPSAAQYGL